MWELWRVEGCRGPNNCFLKCPSASSSRVHTEAPSSWKESVQRIMGAHRLYPSESFIPKGTLKWPVLSTSVWNDSSIWRPWLFLLRRAIETVGMHRWSRWNECHVASKTNRNDNHCRYLVYTGYSKQMRVHFLTQSTLESVVRTNNAVKDRSLWRVRFKQLVHIFIQISERSQHKEQFLMAPRIVSEDWSEDFVL